MCICGNFVLHYFSIVVYPLQYYKCTCSCTTRPAYGGRGGFRRAHVYIYVVVTTPGRAYSGRDHVLGERSGGTAVVKRTGSARVVSDESECLRIFRFMLRRVFV